MGKSASLRAVGRRHPVWRCHLTCGDAPVLTGTHPWPTGPAPVRKGPRDRDHAMLRCNWDERVHRLHTDENATASIRPPFYKTKRSFVFFAAAQCGEVWGHGGKPRERQRRRAGRGARSPQLGMGRGRKADGSPRLPLEVREGTDGAPEREILRGEG
jgi:hypothetical protein